MKSVFCLPWAKWTTLMKNRINPNTNHLGNSDHQRGKKKKNKEANKKTFILFLIFFNSGSIWSVIITTGYLCMYTPSVYIYISSVLQRAHLWNLCIPSKENSFVQNIFFNYLQMSYKSGTCASFVIHIFKW